RWPQILASASAIFFGFLLNIEVNPPSYFTAIYYEILLAALATLTAIATAMFIMPVICHMSHYRKFDVDRFLSRMKQYVLTGIIGIMLTMYLSLGLVLDAKLPILIAYSLASFPFIFVTFRFFRDTRTLLRHKSYLKFKQDHDLFCAGFCQGRLCSKRRII